MEILRNKGNIYRGECRRRNGISGSASASSIETFIFIRIFIGGVSISLFDIFMGSANGRLFVKFGRKIRFNIELIFLAKRSLACPARTYHLTSACPTPIDTKWKNDIIGLTNYRRSILYNNLISQLILLDRSNAPRSLPSFLLFLFSKHVD